MFDVHQLGFYRYIAEGIVPSVQNDGKSVRRTTSIPQGITQRLLLLQTNRLSEELVLYHEIYALGL